jgi:3-oxoacyl-(acyl-carrier-protein) reductase
MTSESSLIADWSLAGRRALVTGGSRGIGRACALALAEAGADVIVASSLTGQSAAAEVCTAIRESGRKAEAVAFDLTDADTIESALRELNEKFGPVHVLVNNAGLTRDRSFRKMSRSEWDTVLTANLTGAFEVTRHVIEPMAQAGWGRIINIASVVGRMGNFGQANYAAAKAGLIGLTRTLAREYARKGITANVVAPGFIRTRMLESVPDSGLQAVVAATPLARLGEPQEIAAAVRFLASPAAGFITGHVLDVNGGLTMS